MAIFYFEWDSGTKTEVQLPSESNSCSNTYSKVNNKHLNAISGIVSGDDPNADENSIGYLTDKLAYYEQGKSAIISWIGTTTSMQDWWQNKYNGCKGCCDVKVLGTCVLQCNCHTKSKYCNTTQGGLNTQKNDWWDIVGAWNIALTSIQTLIDNTHIALANTNAQIQTQIEQEQAKAVVNEIIAETNWQIAYAKGKEQEVEEKMRISKFFTIILPIIILVIVLMFVWRKK